MAGGGEWDLRQQKALRLYLEETHAFPLLSRAEENQLAQQIQQGGDDAEEATETLIKHNLRLVVPIAWRYRTQGLARGLSPGDLIQIGNEGLFKAVSGFDPTKGWRFSTYATPWIRWAIKEAIEKNSATGARLPVGQQKEYKKKRKKWEEDFRQQYKRDPMLEDFDTPLPGWTADDLQEMNKFARLVLGHTQPRRVQDDKPASASRRPARQPRHMQIQPMQDDTPDSTAEQTDPIEDRVEQLLAGLHPTERSVLERRFGFLGRDPETYTEVGRELNINPRTVRMMQEQALEKLHVWAGMLREDGESDQPLPTPPEDEGQKSTSPGALSLDALMFTMGKAGFIETYRACLQEDDIKADDLRALDLGFNENGERILTNAQIAASLGGTTNENNIKQRLWRIGKKVSGSKSSVGRVQGEDHAQAR